MQANSRNQAIPETLITTVAAAIDAQLQAFAPFDNSPVPWTAQGVTAYFF